MKFGLLIECNARNIFVVEKLFPGPFLKNRNWADLLTNSLKILYSLFLLYAKLRVMEIIKTKPQTTFLYLM